MQADIHHITTVIIILGGCVDHPLSNINTSTENDDNSGDVMNVNVNEATGKDYLTAGSHMIALSRKCVIINQWSLC